MKRNAKRLLCAALCLIMVLSILPMAAFAAGTTLYCKAPSNWKNCNVYWWGSSESNPGWPGEAMSQNDEGIWYYDVPSDASNVIFNNGSVQTVDLAMPTDENVMFTYQTAEWSKYDPTPGPVVEVFDYYVAGEGTLCGVAWSPDAAANGMTDADGDGIYTKLYENVATGSYELKITDGTWANSWGKDGGQDNYVLSLEEDAETVEIRFDSATRLITVVIDDNVITPVLPEAGYYVAGNFNDWNAAAEGYKMADNGDGTYSIVLTLEASEAVYELKVTDGTWVNSWGDGAGNVGFYVDAAGDVTVTFDSANALINVSGDSVRPVVKELPEITTVHAVGSVELTGADWDPTANEMTADGSIYTITFTGIAAGTYEFKFAANGAWGTEWASGVEMTSGEIYTAWYKAMGNSSVVIPGNDATVILTLDLTNLDITTGEGGTCSVVVECNNIVPTDPTDPSDPIDPIEGPFFVAGSFNEWNAAAEGYQMIAGENDIYTLTFDLAASEEVYALKVTNGTWEKSWGGTGAGGNYEFNVVADCAVTVTFDAVNGEITVTGDGVEVPEKEPLVINTVHVVGVVDLTGCEWDPTANAMTADGSVYTITFSNVPAGTHEFKFAANGTWDINWASGIVMPSGEVQDAWINPMGNSSIVVEKDNSTVTLTLDLTTMDAISGEGGKCSVTIEAPVIADGLVTIDGQQYYYVAGAQSTHTGLMKIDGIWYYLKSGRVASELSQLVKYNGEWWYVVDGKVASGTTAMVGLNGELWYVVKGKIAGNTTGLVKYDGIWYYVVKGKVAGNTTNLVKYNGEWFYVVKGKVASSTTSMVLYNGEWFYMVKGKLAAKTTTLVKHNGKWCYVIKGKLAGKTTTLVKYNNEWFYVINGYVDSSTTGIVQYSGGWYYLVKGKIAAKTTTLVKYGGAWYYVSGGSVNWKYTGTFVYGGKTYNIKNGKVV